MRVLLSRSIENFEPDATNGADGLIMTLPDTPEERASFSESLRKIRSSLAIPLLIRVAPIENARIDEDLALVMPHAPDGIVLPTCSGRMDVQHLGCKLAVHETLNGFADGKLMIFAEAGETPAACFTLHTYTKASPRLAGLIHSPARLATALNIEWTVSSKEEDTGSPLALAKAQVVLAAASAHVPALIQYSHPGQNGENPTSTPETGLLLHEKARQSGYAGAIVEEDILVPVIASIFSR
ncbi:citrate lyase subunit beta-like protein [Beijerinckia indica]|uniref:Citrate lyase beta subunit-like protein n=1 Tax=Beijerinckia indica subsp. indica (strain ATCC 9039 / DSM 1715 / NCIMB 8712) TaxID=395963 RepID=B2IHJ0_BEII9|nr:citrate lyase subunit beta-like protein [Beijerinckia indica]ACB94511.1 Citrate lyase beta subunit-like protein [Beijerinckia indica subsp. indica ATCC 9039]